MILTKFATGLPSTLVDKSMMRSVTAGVRKVTGWSFFILKFLNLFQS